MAQLAESLTHIAKLKKNVIITFGMHGLTALLGIWAVPLLINGIGVERFGLLTILWAIIGYASVFDFGLARALTQIISKKLGHDDLDSIPNTVWTSIIVITLLGSVAGLFIYAFAPLVATKMNVSEIYFDETVLAIHYLAFSLPMLILIIGLKGILEAYQMADTIALMRVPVMLCNYVLPVFLVQQTDRLDHLVLLLVAGRFISLLGFGYAVLRLFPRFLSRFMFCRTEFYALFSFGSWLTVSNTVSPLMLYLDRVLVSNWLGAAVVAYYTTPYDVVMKMTLVPIAVMSVFFPAITVKAQTSMAEARRMYLKAMKYTGLLIVLPAVVLVIFAKPLIGLWIDVEFAQSSFFITQLLAAGFAVHSLNHVALSTIQALGRSKVAALYHLCELPIVLALLWVFVQQFGLVGAAWTVLIRGVLDGVLLNYLAHRIFQEEPSYEVRVAASQEG